MHMVSGFFLWAWGFLVHGGAWMGPEPDFRMCNVIDLAPRAAVRGWELQFRLQDGDQNDPLSGYSFRRLGSVSTPSFWPGADQ